MSEDYHDPVVYAKRAADELKLIRQMLTDVVNYMRDAEKEIPERVRRFIMYMHDVHDVMNMYHESGHEPPEYVKAEARRCDDRYRQILKEMFAEAGTFEKVRQEMAADPENRWDHTRQLMRPKENRNGEGKN